MLNRIFFLALALSSCFLVSQLVSAKPVENPDELNEFNKLAPLCSYNGYWLNCSNFDSFDVLADSFRNKTYREQELLIIRPLEKLDMDSSFDLTGYDMKYSSLSLLNINSFFYSPDPAKNINGKSLYIRESNLRFVTQKNASINLICDRLASLYPTEKSILTYFRQAITLFKTNQIDDICPYLFKDMSIDLFATQVPLNFLPIDPSVNLNVSVRGFDLEENTFKLDLASVSAQVFGNITSMRTLFVNLLAIDSEFFNHFPYLTYVKLDLVNMGTFLKSTDQSWMGNLNRNRTVKQLTVTLSDANSTFAFSDEDFCLFKDIPHENSVFFQIDTKANLSCSCTVYWLFRNKGLLSYDLSLAPTKKCFTGNLLEEKVRECDFGKRIEACNRVTEAPLTTELPLTSRLLLTTEMPTTTISIATTSTGMPVTNVNTENSFGINIVCNNCTNVAVVNNFHN